MLSWRTRFLVINARPHTKINMAIISIDRMWLFVVEVKQCSCTSIKLYQVHSLTRNIPISNQSFGMGYRYIWPWGQERTRTGSRDFCPSTEHEGWTPNLVLIVVDLTYYYRQSSTM